MRQYISLYMLSISIFLNSMDAPRLRQNKNLTFDQWEFFSEPNPLDKMGPALPFWDSAKGYSAETVAHLHILDHAHFPEKDSIFYAECGQGDTSYFLAQKANKVVAYTENEKAMMNALAKFKHPNLTFSNYFDMGRFDLVVSCHPIADSSLLVKLNVLLNPQGEIFCLFNTQSNKKAVIHQALESMDSKLKECLWNNDYHAFCDYLKKTFNQRPTDNTLKEMIAESKFEILTYKQKTCDVAILKNQHDKFLATCRSFFMALPGLKSSYGCTKKKNKLTNEFIRNVVKILKKDDSDNWIYPFDFTIVHIKETNI